MRCAASPAALPRSSGLLPLGPLDRRRWCVGAGAGGTGAAEVAAGIPEPENEGALVGAGLLPLAPLLLVLRAGAEGAAAAELPGVRYLCERMWGACQMNAHARIHTYTRRHTLNRVARKARCRSACTLPPQHTHIHTTTHLCSAACRLSSDPSSSSVCGAPLALPPIPPWLLAGRCAVLAAPATVLTQCTQH